MKAAAAANRLRLGWPTCTPRRHVSTTRTTLYRVEVSDRMMQHGYTISINELRFPRRHVVVRLCCSILGVICHINLQRNVVSAVSRRVRATVWHPRSHGTTARLERALPKMAADTLGSYISAVVLETLRRRQVACQRGPGPAANQRTGQGWVFFDWVPVAQHARNDSGQTQVNPGGSARAGSAAVQRVEGPMLQGTYNTLNPQHYESLDPCKNSVLSLPCLP